MPELKRRAGPPRPWRRRASCRRGRPTRDRISGRPGVRFPARDRLRRASAAAIRRSGCHQPRAARGGPRLAQARRQETRRGVPARAHGPCSCSCAPGRSGGADKIDALFAAEVAQRAGPGRGMPSPASPGNPSSGVYRKRASSFIKSRRTLAQSLPVPPSRIRTTASRIAPT